MPNSLVSTRAPAKGASNYCFSDMTSKYWVSTRAPAKGASYRIIIIYQHRSKEQLVPPRRGHQLSDVKLGVRGGFIWCPREGGILFLIPIASEIKSFNSCPREGGISFTMYQARDL